MKDLNFNRFCTVGPSGRVSTVALFKKVIIIIIIFNLTVNFWKQLVTLGLRETFQGWDSSWTWVTLGPSRWYVRLCGAVRAARSWCRCLPSRSRSMMQRVCPVAMTSCCWYGNTMCQVACEVPRKDWNARQVESYCRCFKLVLEIATLNFFLFLYGWRELASLI